MTPEALGLACILAVLALVVLRLKTVSFAALPNPLAVVIGAVIIDTAAHRCRGSRIGQGAQDAVFAILFVALASMAGVLAAYAGQRLNLPLQDRFFAAMDSAMGVDWRDSTLFVDRHSTLAEALSFSYETMSAQIVAPIVILAFGGRTQRLRIYLLAYVFALAITDTGAALLPALSPIASVARADYHVLGFTGASPLEHIEALRGTGPAFISGALGGIVSFPSFHASVAVLTPLTLRHDRIALLVLLPLDALMLPAAMTEGAHYACDVVAGIAVALIADIVATRVLSRRRERVGPLQRDASDLQAIERLSRMRHRPSLDTSFRQT